MSSLQFSYCKQTFSRQLSPFNTLEHFCRTRTLNSYEIVSTTSRNGPACIMPATFTCLPESSSFGVCYIFCYEMTSNWFSSGALLLLVGLLLYHATLNSFFSANISYIPMFCDRTIEEMGPLLLLLYFVVCNPYSDVHYRWALLLLHVLAQNVNVSMPALKSRTTPYGSWADDVTELKY